jgi:hypothetical protein
VFDDLKRHDNIEGLSEEGDTQRAAFTQMQVCRWWRLESARVQIDSGCFVPN